MNENDSFVAREHHIRTTGEVISVQSVTKSHSVDNSSHQKLWFGPLALSHPLIFHTIAKV